MLEKWTLQYIECECIKHLILLHLACSTSCLECSYSVLGLSSRKGLQTLEKWLSRPRNVAWSHLGLSMSTGEGISSVSAVAPLSPRPLTSSMLQLVHRSGVGVVSSGGFPYLYTFPYIPPFPSVCRQIDRRKTQSGEAAISS